MKSKPCKRSWLYFGIISGFLFGFFYFAFGIYIHSQDKVLPSMNDMNLLNVHAGTTQ